MPDPMPAGINARYETLDELGRGGMGIVYRARDRETGEVVAVKVLKPEIAADSSSIDRFKNELRLARRITHKNVCRIYEFSRANDTAYISMELVQGESLRSILSRFGTLSFKKGIEIARQVCAGLREAHGQGIIHRDLKPENIILDTLGNAKIMDFGIARSVEAGTTATTIVGTPAYMAPEQAEGKAVDHRSDVYALGLILYEMFTGASAFAGDTPVAVLMKQIREQPVAPHELEPTIPPWLERAILKCLEKDPAERFQSVDDLEAALTTPSEALLPKERRPSLRKPLRLGALSSVAAGMAVLAFLLGLYVGRELGGPRAPMHHDSQVYSVAFSPDGRLLASASEDRTIKIWAIPQEREVRTLRGHTGSVNSITFSPDGQSLASGSSDKTVKLWNANTGHEQRTLQGHSAQVNAVAFRQDGRWLASGSDDGVVKIWEVDTGQPLHSLKAHEVSVTAISFSPDGQLLASGGSDGAIKLWELSSDRELRRLVHADQLTAMSFSPDGRWLASGGASKVVRLWEVATGREFQTLAGHSDWVNAVLFSSSGQWLISGSDDGTIRLWDAAMGIERRTLTKKAGTVADLALSPRGNRLAWGNAEGDVKVLQVEELK